MNGLIGISLSMYSFGLAKDFWSAVIARSLNGALNGNIGVLKSQFGALFDETNMAYAYAYVPMAWSTGSTLGPLIGGGLSWPTRRFPDTFGHSKFFADYPYFLPCAVPATFAALAWVVSYFFLEETVKQPVSLLVFLRLRKAPGNLVLQNVVEGQDPSATEDPAPESSSSPGSSAHTRVNSRADSVAKDTDDGAPLPLRALLIRDVIVAGGNYALLSLVDIAFRAIQPLFFSTPRELGGLGLDPPAIGKILAVYGVMNGLFQIFMFARINARFGSKNTFMVGIVATTVMYASFPALTLVADARGAVDGWVYAVIGVQLVASMMTSLSYGLLLPRVRRQGLTCSSQAASSSSSRPPRQTVRRLAARTGSARCWCRGCARSGPGSRTRSSRSLSASARGRCTTCWRRSPSSRLRARASSRTARGASGSRLRPGARLTKPRLGAWYTKGTFPRM
jgi:hypothetical protein